MSAVSLRNQIKSTPLLGDFASGAARQYRRRRFPGSTEFWERHYSAGYTSGWGSLGRLARFKADVINDLCREWSVRSVIEWGCGDGNQLSLLDVPGYTGIDVSRSAIESCLQRFPEDPEKSFFWYDPKYFLDSRGIFSADLALSLDVIYHLVEDDVFRTYMKRLFRSARNHVVIYSSNAEGLRSGAPHVSDRRFTDHVEAAEPGWRLVRTIENRHPYTNDDPAGSLSNFYCYERVTPLPSSTASSGNGEP